MNAFDLHTQAILPAGHIVCRRLLLPLTVGHARILDALELWDASTPADLMLASFICSRPAKAFVGALQSRWTVLRLALWKRFVLGKAWDFANSKRHWDHYKLCNRDAPMAVYRGKGRPSSTPMLACMRVKLCSGMNYNPLALDDVPLAQATLDYWTLLEAEDAVKLQPETVEGFRAKVAYIRSQTCSN